MSYDKNDNIRKLFVANQSRLNSKDLITAIKNVCENIKKIYVYAMPDADDADNEYHILIAIADYDEKKFNRFVQNVTKPEDGIEARSQQNLAIALNYVYKVVNGKLTAKELVADGIKTENDSKIIDVLKEIFVDHLEQLISRAEKKLSPEQYTRKLPRKQKHVEHLLAKDEEVKLLTF